MDRLLAKVSPTAHRPARLLTQLASLLPLAEYVPVQRHDYTNFRLRPPRSILVLPPVNDSTAVEGSCR